jgi:5-methylcytosine-specific restriction endonuclease McrA
MSENNDHPAPTRDQFESRKDFVRAYDRWRDKYDPRRKARQKTRTEAGYQNEQYDKHREKRLAEKKALYEAKRAMLLERQAKWRNGNRDKLKARDERRYKENRAAFYANNWLRRQVMVAAAPPWMAKEHWEAIADMYVEAKRMTELTGIAHVVDHIWPLRGKTSCGLHVPWNLQITTAEFNKIKGNREPLC